MQVHEVMHKELRTAAPDTKLTEVAKLMREGDFGVVPVCRDDEVIGMITDRDIVVRAVAESKNVSNCRAEDVMTTDVLSCRETDDVEEVAQTMSERQVRRVVVLDAQGKLTGIVSLGDLAREDLLKAGRALGNISEPKHNEPTHAH